MMLHIRKSDSLKNSIEVCLKHTRLSVERRMRKFWNVYFESCVIYAEFPFSKLLNLERQEITLEIVYVMLHNVMIIIISARASLFKVIEAIFSRVAAKSLNIGRAVRYFYQT